MLSLSGYEAYESDEMLFSATNMHVWLTTHAELTPAILTKVAGTSCLKQAMEMLFWI